MAVLIETKWFRRQKVEHWIVSEDSCQGCGNSFAAASLQVPLFWQPKPFATVRTTKNIINIEFMANICKLYSYVELESR